jgi:hypothetical protein
MIYKPFRKENNPCALLGLFGAFGERFSRFVIGLTRHNGNPDRVALVCVALQVVP